IVWFHVWASKANLTLVVPFVTGGSWKKSPVTTTWIAAYSSMDFRSMPPILASLSNKSPSTIETDIH
ncbi:hypothetical protein HYDPIDRAFT_88507, partial [Hydnomerulius pinastri MD-312]